MNLPVNQHVTPLGCRWILFRKWSDFVHPTGQTRALCVRIPNLPRVVTEEECRRCQFWERSGKRAC